MNNPDTGNKILASTITSAAAGSNCPAGGTDPRCTATVTVLIPALTITKTAAVTTTTPGSTFGYTITVDDTGPTPYAAATITDPSTACSTTPPITTTPRRPPAPRPTRARS